MTDPIQDLLKTILEAHKALGEVSFPLDPKVLKRFLQTSQTVKVEALETSEIMNPEKIEQAEAFTLPDGPKEVQWQWLKNRVLNCPHCLKHLYPGKKLVFGSGNLDADIFFCGEAPGADEEEQGEVFVGRAGQLLTKIIEAMGLKRSDV